MQKKDDNALLQEDNLNSRVYELGYLLVPKIAEEDVAISYGNLKELISSLSGGVITDEMPRMISLSYPMQKIISNVRNKFDKAYFGWTKFTMDRERVLELKNRLYLDSNFIRFLILKTVKENTIAAKRFIHGEAYRRAPTVKKNASNETVTPINKEEIDKEIDALIAT